MAAFQVWAPRAGKSGTAETHPVKPFAARRDHRPPSTPSQRLKPTLLGHSASHSERLFLPHSGRSLTQPDSGADDENGPSVPVADGFATTPTSSRTCRVLLAGPPAQPYVPVPSPPRAGLNRRAPSFVSDVAVAVFEKELRQGKPLSR